MCTLDRLNMSSIGNAQHFVENLYFIFHILDKMLGVSSRSDEAITTQRTARYHVRSVGKN